MKCCKLFCLMLSLTALCLLFLTCSPAEPEKQKLELSIYDISGAETFKK